MLKSSQKITKEAEMCFNVHICVPDIVIVNTETIITDYG